MSTEWCMEERCRHRHWRSGSMPTHRRGDDCPPESRPVTGMEHAIEQAARIIHGCTGDEDGAPVAARALAEAGLLFAQPSNEQASENEP